MTLAERADNYAKTFPDWPAPRTDSRWLDTVWVLGNDYQGSGYYGAYPPGYLKRVMALFPEIDPSRERILHLFSGSLRSHRNRGVGFCLDIKTGENANTPPWPDVRGDARELPFLDRTFDLVLADTPYSEKHAEQYGTGMPNRRIVLGAVQRVLKVGGNLVWLDTKHPMYRKDIWKWWGAIGIVRSGNHDYRFATCYERLQ